MFMQIGADLEDNSVRVGGWGRGRGGKERAHGN